MTDLATIAAQARAKAESNPNPASEAASTARAPERKRVPMTLPQQRLAVPEIPGYHLHWMKGTPERLAQAQAAGYEFVDASEVNVNNHDLGGDASKSGNTDMGSRVSTLGSATGDGDRGADGQPLRLYLMKQKEEWYREDQRILEDRNDGIANTLNAAYSQGMVGGKADGENADDVAARYVDSKRTRRPGLFTKKLPRGGRPA